MANYFYYGRLTATTPALTREGEDEHTLSSEACVVKPTAFYHTADSPCSHPRATASEDNAALGQLTDKPVGAQPDYRGRWCAVSREHSDRPNPPSPRATLGQLCTTPWKLQSTIGKGIAWIRTRDLQAIERILHSRGAKVVVFTLPTPLVLADGCLGKLLFHWSTNKYCELNSYGVVLQFTLQKMVKIMERKVGKRHGITEVNPDVVSLVSHATQERLRTLVEKMTVASQHRTRSYKSRSNKEDPDQLRLKQKAKETIGNGDVTGASQSAIPKQFSRLTTTRASLKDLIFCMEQEQAMRQSITLYRAFLK
ncbi:UNVERIFIED_CONTAM: hypothetical protein FKN15_062484 [Acipenser sinensis]